MNNGFAVEFNGQSKVAIYAPREYGRGKMTGLCGNFDNRPVNDLSECNGRKYTGPDDLFGDTCIVEDSDEDAR